MARTADVMMMMFRQVGRILLLPVAWVTMDRRPVGHYREVARVEWPEFLCRIYGFATEDGQYRFQRFDLLIGEARLDQHVTRVFTKFGRVERERGRST